MSKNQPILNLPDSKEESIINKLTFAIVVLHLLVLLYYYGQLPEKVPTHFGINGEADAWGSKISLWFLPLISLATNFLLYFISRKPHTFNFPKKITSENAATEYSKAKWGIALMNIGIAVLFFTITWTTIQIALGQPYTLGWGFNLLVLAIIIVPLAVMLRPSKV